MILFEYCSFVKEVIVIYFLVMIFYNVCFIVVCGMLIVVFFVVFKWFILVVLVFYELICIIIYVYRNYKYFSEKEVWWIVLLFMLCYVFVYLGFKVMDFNVKLFDIKFGRFVIFLIFFYFCFIGENVVMILLFYLWLKMNSDLWWNLWIFKVIIIFVIVLFVVGMVI